MVLDSEFRSQRNTTQHSFTSRAPVAIVSAILLSALMVGAGGYLLATKIPKKASEQRNKSLFFLPSPTLPARATTNEIDAVNCVNDISKMVFNLPSCKGLDGAKHRSCGEKRKATFAILKTEAKIKLDACYYKYRSYFPRDYKPGTNVVTSLNPFVGVETAERRSAETELNVACVLVNEALKAYHEETGEYPNTLSALVPLYLHDFPMETDRVVYERDGPDKFDYIIYETTGAEFTITQKDLFDTYQSPFVADRCREWAQQRSSP